VAITRYVQPAAAGLLMQQELSALGRILQSPERPLVAILGGAKVSDKLALVEHLLGRVDALLVGGGMAFTFLLALGHPVGRSLVEADCVETARAALNAARRRGVRLVVPLDTVVAASVDSASGRAVGGRGDRAVRLRLDGRRRVSRVPRGPAAPGRRGAHRGAGVRTPIVIGNWKMHGTVAEARTLAGAIREAIKRPRGVQVVVCPPF